MEEALFSGYSCYSVMKTANGSKKWNSAMNRKQQELFSDGYELSQGSDEDQIRKFTKRAVCFFREFHPAFFRQVI
ncbi:hypothetical protein E2562_038085 [Oryza meyeriana var. granulata]|uniref:Uncharacterized protein n=1 Tax=Oryza meyeriana var. granulata TaxID=110450 RepID=A0A6G1EU32_9ORYZ|nr:hypothetical protein E2562_038085 [Oryza meyeriana var. granulata]